MNFLLIFQLAQLAAQFLQTTNILSPSPTTASLSRIADAIIKAQDQDPVKWLQGALNNLLGANLDVDGEFGPLTEAAVIQALGQFLNQQESGQVLEAIKILISKV
jgi:peptidoglycan hydrolase-like protein with peptidoglycan-binding domain